MIERTSGRTNTHNSLQHDGHSKDRAKLVAELESVLAARRVEPRIIVRLTGRVVRKAGQTSDILVRLAEQEHVHRNLGARAFDGEGLVEGRCSLQKTGFLTTMSARKERCSGNDNTPL